jgi:hypothetical protein
MSVKEYLNVLKSTEGKGGSLFCKSKGGGESFKYGNCADFKSLKKKGCYGYTTREMGAEITYEGICDEINAIKRAGPATIDYFNPNAQGWWKSLPAEIIPISGGAYSDDSYAQAKAERRKLVSGKTLGQLQVKSQTVKNGQIELVLNIDKDECGEIRDTFGFWTVLLADFDNDGISELLIKGFRRYESESCFLGTANNLGTGFGALLKKTKSANKPVLLLYPSK